MAAPAPTAGLPTPSLGPRDVVPAEPGASIPNIQTEKTHSAPGQCRRQKDGAPPYGDDRGQTPADRGLEFAPARFPGPGVFSRIPTGYQRSPELLLQCRRG